MKTCIKISFLIGLIIFLGNCGTTTQERPVLTNEVQLQETADAKKPRLVFQKGHAKSVNTVAFSPNGQIFVSGSWDNTIKLWDAQTGRELRTLSGHLNGIKAVTFSPDGQTIASGSVDKTIKIWDVHTGNELFTFKRYSEAVNSVAFSPDGQCVASGSVDEIIRIWDIRTGKNTRKFTGHSKAITSIAFSPDGQLLASGSWDKTIKLWRARTGKERRTLTGHSEWVTSIAFSPDGQLLASGSGDGTIILWDVRSGKRRQVLTGHSDDVMFVAFNPNGRIIASGGKDKTIKLWDIQNGKELYTLTGHLAEITSVAFNPDGTIIASGSWDNTLKFWDVNTGKELRTLTGYTERITPVFLSSDGHIRVRVNRDEPFRFWDDQTDKEHRKYAGDAEAISPDNRLLAYTGGGQPSEKRKIRLWDIRKPTKQLCELKGHSKSVRSLAFSPNSEILASGSSDKSIMLWNTGHVRRFVGKKIATLRGHSGTVVSLTFSLDGNILASGSEDATVKMWDIQTGKELHTLTGHSGKIESIVFNLDGTILASEGPDKILKLWDVTSGKEMATVIAVADHEWAVITPGGQFDASPEAMELMHWVVGLEPVELTQLKERYYEPGLLPKLLGLSAEPLRKVPEFAEAELYPEMEVVATEPETPKARLHLTNQGGGIGKVAVFLNGKEVTEDARGEQVDPQAQEAELEVDLTGHPFILPGEQNRVEVKAYNAEGYLVSRGLNFGFQAPQPAAVQEAPEQPVSEQETPQQQPVETTISPHVWAIVAGIADYQGEELDLKFAAKDAEDMVHALQLGAKRLFGADKVHVTLLTSPEFPSSEGPGVGSLLPTRENLLAAFDAAKAAKSTDILVIYLAGHGVNHGGQEGDYYYLTAEARTGNLTDPVVRAQTAISSQELTELIKQIPALKQVLILDTCESGRFVDNLTAKRDIPSSQIRALERMKDRTGLHILAGSAANAVSYEATRYGQGLLTYSLLLGMRGAALREEEYVDISRLFEFAADRVPQLAKDIGGIQRPVVATPKSEGSFDVGRLTREDKPQIPLANVRPLVLRASFQDETRIVDHLGLTKRVNAKLREVAARGRNAPLVFVDAVEFPEAYSVVGRYKIDGDKITVLVYLFRGKDEAGQFMVEGNSLELEGLVEALAKELEKNL